MVDGHKAGRQGGASEALELEKYLHLTSATSHLCDPGKDLPSPVLSLLIYKMGIMIVFTFQGCGGAKSKSFLYFSFTYVFNLQICPTMQLCLQGNKLVSQFEGGSKAHIRSFRASDEKAQASVASEWDVPHVSRLQPSRTRTPSTPQLSICGPSGTPSGEKATVPLLGRRKGARGRSVQEIAAQCWVITACVGTTLAWAVTRTTGSE